MGAWGHGAFENDDALGWAAELEHDGVAAVESALVYAAQSDYIEVDAGSRGLAAAEAIATAVSNPTSSMPDAVMTLVEHHGDELRALRESALRAVQRVGGPESELASLWDEAGGQEWRDGLQSLEQRLSLA